MAFLYKPDWEETKQRYLAWWAHEALDRCGLAVRAPKASVPKKPLPTPSRDPETRWTDLEYYTRYFDVEFRQIYYGGEALPIWHQGYAGHTSIPVFLGAPLHLDQNTAWMEPVLTGEDLDVSHLKIDRTNKWWQFHLKELRYAVKAARGQAVVSVGAFGGSGDTLAALRGTDRLLYDLIDRPDQVRAADEYLMRMWCEVYDEFYGIIRETGEGSTCWFTLWSPGKFYAAQNDFSYMISQKMFQDIFLPVIEKQTRFLDHTVYHVDGVGAFAHVPALCDLPRLQAIQILPGAGKPSPLHYLDILKYVQKKGKNLQLSLAASEVETALSKLSARGLMIHTNCATEAEARQLLENAKKWSRDR